LLLLLLLLLLLFLTSIQSEPGDHRAPVPAGWSPVMAIFFLFLVL
jgi:hypothetical protein